MKYRRRIFMTVTGVVVSGIGSGFIKAAMLGVDPCTGAISGISQALGMGYGNFYIIFNFFLFLGVWFMDKHYIGAATLINMTGLGYIVQYTSEGLLRWMEELSISGIGVQMVIFGIGILILCAGTALYFTADMGVSTYDASALILRDRTGRSLKSCRIKTDLICVTLALIFRASIGIGTVVTAFCMGPFIEFFNRKLAEPILYGRKERRLLSNSGRIC